MSRFRPSWFMAEMVGRIAVIVVVSALGVSLLINGRWYGVFDFGTTGVWIWLTVMRVKQKRRANARMNYLNVNGLPPTQNGMAELMQQAAVAPRETAEVLSGWREYALEMADGKTYLHGALARWGSGTLEATCSHGLKIEDCLLRSADQNLCGVYVLKRHARHIISSNQTQMYMTPSGPIPLIQAIAMGYAHHGTYLLAHQACAVLARVVCGGVVQRCTAGYVAQTVRIEQMYFICGEKELGDLGTMGAEDAERIAAEIEERYDAPVEITTWEVMDGREVEEEKARWLRLAHTSRQYVSRYQSEHPDTLNPRLSDELKQILNASENQ